MLMFARCGFRGGKQENTISPITWCPSLLWNFLHVQSLCITTNAKHHITMCMGIMVAACILHVQDLHNYYCLQYDPCRKVLWTMRLPCSAA